MKSTFSSLLLGLLANLAFLPVAEAHTFGVQGSGLAEGLAHPFSGFDHWLAMVAVGIWAIQLGGRLAWLAPLSFMTVMTVSAGIGAMGMELPLLEPTIAGSVLALGLLITFDVRMGTAAGIGLVSVFAFFHGYAHGLEFPWSASPTLYSLGFLASTATLLVIGLGLGWSFRRTDFMARLCGSMIAVTGLFLLASV